MPHRRRVQKGSFGSHFDELVKHFPHERPEPASADVTDCDKPRRDRDNVHDKLFERAWREGREREQPSR